MYQAFRKYDDKYGEVVETSKTISMYEVAIPSLFAESKFSYAFDFDKHSKTAIATVKRKGTGMFGGSWKVYKQEKLDCREI